MSWTALNWAEEQVCHTPNAKFVLIMLANRADEQHTCYPGLDLLVKGTQLGESTIRRALTQLTKGGQIRVLQRWGRRGSRKSNRYQLLLSGPDTPLPEVGDWQSEYTPKKRPKAVAEPGTEEAPEQDETIPLESSGMPDQGDQTARSERFDENGEGIPLDSSGLNRSNRAVSYKEEPSVTNHQNPPTPTEINMDSGSPVVPAVAGGAETRKIQTVDDAVDWFVSTGRGRELGDRFPKWRRDWVRQALATAIERQLGDLRACTKALQALARTDDTRSARRLVEAGPWWDAATVFIPAQPDNRPRCPKPGHADAEEGCRQCASEAKTALEPPILGPVDPRAAKAGEAATEALKRNLQAGGSRAAGLVDAAARARVHATV